MIRKDHEEILAAHGPWNSPCVLLWEPMAGMYGFKLRRSLKDLQRYLDFHLARTNVPAWGYVRYTLGWREVRPSSRRYRRKQARLDARVVNR